MDVGINRINGFRDEQDQWMKALQSGSADVVTRRTKNPQSEEKKLQRTCFYQRPPHHMLAVWHPPGGRNRVALSLPSLTRYLCTPGPMYHRLTVC